MGSLYEPPIVFVCGRCAALLRTLPKRALVSARGNLCCTVCGSSNAVVSVDEVRWPGRVPTITEAIEIVRRGL